jgi:ATP-dependent Clp protease protease subunit
MNGPDLSAKPRFPGLMDSLDEGSNYIWVNEFDDQSLQLFYASFTRLEGDPSVQIIPIFIASYGGDTTVLAAMRDLIKSCPKPVATIAMGKAMSCGTGLLAAGTKGYRFSSPGSSVMIHQVSSGTGGKASDIVSDAASVQLTNNIMFKNLASDIGCTATELHSEIQKRNNADWYLTPAECIKWGIIDHIGTPRVHSQSPATGLILTQGRPTSRPKKPKSKSKK